MLILKFVQGETWSQYFTCTDDNGNPIGDASWGAEFGLFSGATQEALANAAPQITWKAPGTVIVTLPASMTSAWTWGTGSWYLDLISPDTSLDPAGFRMNAARGLATLLTHAPSFSEVASAPTPQYALMPAPSLASPTV